MLDRVTVLMTSVGTDSFPDVLRAWRSNGEREIRVVGVDVRPSAAGLYLADNGYLVPSRSNPMQLLQRLEEICQKEQINFIYPGSTEDQEFFAAQTERFSAKGIRIIVSLLASLQIANDKFKLSEFARARNIPCADFYAARNWDEFQRAADRLGYPRRPIVVKLNRGTGAQGLKIIRPSLDARERMLDRDNRDVAFYEMETWLKSMESWPPLHLAEYLGGEEYSVDILCDEGRVISAVTRLRLSTIYGLALHAQVIDEPAVRKVACELVEKLKLSYIINVQVRLSDSGEPRLLEVNPRIPGTIGLTVAAGVNMPYLALKISLGESFDVPKPRIGMTILRYWGGHCLPVSDLLR